MIAFYLNNLFYLYCYLYYIIGAFFIYYFYFLIKNKIYLLYEKKINFFFFKIPTECQLRPNSKPFEQDLITFNCLLEKSLHSKFFFRWINQPKKISYEQLTYSEHQSRYGFQLSKYFFGKKSRSQSELGEFFIRKKEKILYEYFIPSNIHTAWYEFKGYKPFNEFIFYLDKFF